ncbi:MAG TPA: hypothetical protein VMX17_03065 [Candidatus Glassbacteria bacterium]|nr:hypothetical protein [Candidatus Glassbacteria bacterium]
MTNKMLFSIDNIELLEENPDSRFSILSLDFFASGNNLHNTYVSEETLRRTASTIKNCPLVWKLDGLRNDIGTHDIEEVPCGVVPEEAEIFEKKMPDGRIMLSVKAFVWKHYSGKLLDFFERDGDKPISVEIEVLDFEELEDEIIELCDYRFQAITVLGSKIEPAIPLAHATVLKFAEEYKRDYELEFSKKYESIDLSIPKEVKVNAKKGLDLYESHGRGGNPVSLALARHLIKMEKTNHLKIRHMSKIFSSKKFENIDEDSISDSYIGFMLYGGNEGYEWVESTENLLDEEDAKNLTYFEEEGEIMPYKNLGEINGALKGIDPPITLGQANAIAAQADAIGVDEDKNGWAIAIANFKKTHMVVDGTWVKKEEDDFSAENLDGSVSVDKDNKLEKEDENSVNNQKIEQDKVSFDSLQVIEVLNSSLSEFKYGEQKLAKYWVEAVDEEYAYIHDQEDKKEYRAKYTVEEEIANVHLDKKEEVTKGEYKVAGSEEIVIPMSEKVDIDDLMSLFGEEADDAFKAEFDKEDKDKDFSVIINSMLAKMKVLSESNKEFASSNEELQKFKNTIEEERFSFEVDAALKELQETVDIPEKAIKEMREKSLEYTLETIDGWKNDCKAQAFSYAVKKVDNDSKENRIGLPWGKQDQKKSIWDNLSKK